MFILAISCLTASSLLWIHKMSMFILAISCLTASSLLWIIYLRFQVPVQYCSPQHQTLLSSAVTSTTGHCFLFGFVCSFFLELFLQSSPVVGHLPTLRVHLQCHILCLFILFMGVWRQEYWSGLPFHFPVDHVFWQNSPPWPVPLGWPCIAWLIVSLS